MPSFRYLQIFIIFRLVVLEICDSSFLEFSKIRGPYRSHEKEIEKIMQCCQKPPFYLLSNREFWTSWLSYSFVVVVVVIVATQSTLNESINWCSFKTFRLTWTPVFSCYSSVPNMRAERKKCARWNFAQNTKKECRVKTGSFINNKRGFDTQSPFGRCCCFGPR